MVQGLEPAHIGLLSGQCMALLLSLSLSSAWRIKYKAKPKCMYSPWAPYTPPYTQVLCNVTAWIEVGEGRDEMKVRDRSRHSEKHTGFAHGNNGFWMCICAVAHENWYFVWVGNAPEQARNWSLKKSAKVELASMKSGSAWRLCVTMGNIIVSLVVQACDWIWYTDKGRHRNHAAAIALTLCPRMGRGPDMFFWKSVEL